LPVLAVPADPADATSKSLNRIWEKEIDKYFKRKTYLANNMQTVYSLIWGQCTDVMRQKVEALAVYETLTMNGDGLELLKAIKDLWSTISKVRNICHMPFMSQSVASTSVCKEGTWQNQCTWSSFKASFT
jgi:hypothetical protein